jgi:hypothetical protein
VVPKALAFGMEGANYMETKTFTVVPKALAVEVLTAVNVPPSMLKLPFGMEGRAASEA